MVTFKASLNSSLTLARLSSCLLILLSPVRCDGGLADGWQDASTLETRICTDDEAGLELRVACGLTTPSLLITAPCKECVDANQECCDAVEACFGAESPKCATCYRDQIADESCTGLQALDSVRACLFAERLCGLRCFPNCAY